MRHVSLGLTGLFLFTVTSCAQCAPDQVGQGVARLTVRNVGAMVSLVAADTACGFGSDAVNAGAVATGDIGGPGKLTFTVTSCSIDAGKSKDLGKDCAGADTTAAGKVVISATKEIVGTLTGDATNPIVPAGPDAVTITITKADFTSFEVTSSTSKNKLTQVKGSLSAVAKPRLAVSESTGACAVVTPNVQFTKIAYAASTVHVDSPDNTFDADVATSDIAAQNGAGPGGENKISGSMTVFGSKVDVADDGKLDPDYDAAKFKASYVCTDDLAAPESFTCADLTPALADGASRLTIKMLATIASLLDADTTCGFSSAAVQGAPTVTGAPGGEGSLAFTATACTLTFADATTLSPDCGGASTIVKGSVTVTATKTVSGRLTGNNASPVVPITDQPAVIALSSVAVDNFSVSSTSDHNSLLARNGTLSGSVSPQVFLGSDTGVCSVTSPNASFTGVTWGAASLLLGSDQGSFEVNVDSAALTATNGVIGASTNAIGGTVTVAGNALTIPSDGLGLDPAPFDQAAFDASWQCAPNLVLPASNACAQTLGGTIAGGAAALTMRTLGAVASIVDADTNCGFGSGNVTPSFDALDPGHDGHALTLALTADCTLPFGATGVVVSTDCVGDTNAVAGTITIKAGSTKTVSGWETGDASEPIVPSSFKPADLDLDVTFADFAVTSANAAGDVGAVLTVHDGELAGTVTPRTALDPTTNACSIATPNATFSGVTWTAAHTTLVNAGNAFDALLDTSALTAQAGSDDTTVNALAGSISVDGNNVTLPANTPLDPAFVQADFDATYTCDPGNGIVPVLVPDAACSFRQVLGNAAARLLVQATATATSVLDGNASCGFADTAPDHAPVVTGTPGGPGNVTLTSDDACSTTLPASFQLSVDCNGTSTRAGGTFTVASASKSINGFLTGSNPPVFPVARDAATLALTNVVFDAWNVFSQPTTGVAPATITVSGTVSAVTLSPIAGRSNDDSAAASGATGGAITDVFDVATPVAGVAGLAMSSADVTLVLEGKTFIVALTDVSVDAFAGAFFDGTTQVGDNTVAGSLAVDGEPVTIATAPLASPYDQAAFDATYSCNPALAGDVVPSAP